MAKAFEVSYQGERNHSANGRRQNVSDISGAHERVNFRDLVNTGRYMPWIAIC